MTAPARHHWLHWPHSAATERWCFVRDATNPRCITAIFFAAWPQPKPRYRCHFNQTEARRLWQHLTDGGFEPIAGPLPSIDRQVPVAWPLPQQTSTPPHTEEVAHAPVA